MTIESYRDLEVWQKAMDFAVACYEKTKGFPKDEIYGLTSQLRRAAVSIPSNIAEGRGRRQTKEFLRFLDIAYGSLTEVETQIMIARRLDYLHEEAKQDLLQQSAAIGRMLNALMTSLRRRLESSMNPES